MENSGTPQVINAAALPADGSVRTTTPTNHNPTPSTESWMGWLVRSTTKKIVPAVVSRTLFGEDHVNDGGMPAEDRRNAHADVSALDASSIMGGQSRIGQRSHGGLPHSSSSDKAVAAFSIVQPGGGRGFANADGTDGRNGNFNLRGKISEFSRAEQSFEVPRSIPSSGNFELPSSGNTGHRPFPVSHPISDVSVVTVDDDGETLGHATQYSAASAARIRELEQLLQASEEREHRSREKALEAERELERASRSKAEEESPLLFDVPDGASEVTASPIAQVDKTVGAGDGDASRPLLGQEWAARGCSDPACQRGCGSVGGISSSSSSSKSSSTGGSINRTSSSGHARGVFAAASQEFTRSGGLNLSVATVDSIETNFPNVSFRSKQATAPVRAAASSNQTSSFSLDEAAVVVPKSKRLEKDHPGFLSQRDLLMGTGKYAVKESEKLGGWDYDVYSANVNGPKSTHSASDADETMKAYKSNVRKIQDIKTHCVKFDLMQPLYILKPKEGISTTTLSNEDIIQADLEDLVDSINKESYRDIFKEWARLTTDEVKWLQRIYNLHPSIFDTDRESNNLLYQFVHNQLTTDFRERVDRLYKSEFSQARGEAGGITYLFVVLRKVLIGTQASVDVLFADLSKFFKQGPAYLNNGENIVSLAWHLKHVLIEPLASMNGFDRSRGDSIADLLEARSKSSCPTFAQMFADKYRARLTATGSDAGSLDCNVSEMLSSRAIADKMLKILDDAENQYENLVRKHKYVTKNGKALSFNLSNGSNSNFVKSGCRCFNCGEPHTLADCPKEHDEEAIAKNKAEFRRLKKERGGSSGGGGKSSDVPTRDSSGSTGNDKSKPDWRRKKGTVQFKCATCNRWGNHTDAFHERAQEVGPSFSMVKTKARKTHPGVKVLANLASSGGSGSEKKDGDKKDSKAFDEYTQKLQTLTAKLGTQPTGSELHTELKAEISALTANYKAQNFC